MESLSKYIQVAYVDPLVDSLLWQLQEGDSSGTFYKEEERQTLMQMAFTWERGQLRNKLEIWVKSFFWFDLVSLQSARPFWEDSMGFIQVEREYSRSQELLARPSFRI